MEVIMRKNCKQLIIGTALSLLFCTSALSGCGNSKDSYSSDPTDFYAETAAAAQDNSYSNDAESYEAENSGNGMDTANNAEPINYEAKIIKNASIVMTAIDVNKAYKMLLDYAAANSGYEFERSLSSSNGYITINATIKVKPDKLDDLVDYASQCGTVLSSNISSEDITAEYYDAQIRLENKRINLKNYYKLLENAVTTEEIITIQNHIDNLTAEIESYEGQLKLWNSLVQESTLTIYITQEDNPEAIEEKIEWDSLSLDKMLRFMGNGFKKTCNAIISAIQWIAVVIVSFSPVIVIAGIVIIVIILKKKKTKKIKKEDNNKEISEDPKL
jgi:hypothetical protein